MIGGFLGAGKTTAVAKLAAALHACVPVLGNHDGFVVAAFGLLPPWLAALGMCGSSLLVTLNALRLARPMRATPLPSAIAQVLPA